MKQIILTILLSIICANSLFAQTVDEPTLTSAEIQEAQQLAARFYNRLAETQDVEPLIKEFFIRDFVRKFKATAEHQEGKIFLNKPLQDIQRFYSVFINYFFLYLMSYKHLDFEGKQSDELKSNTINAELAKIIQDDNLLTFNRFDYEKIISIIEIKKLSEFRKKLSKAEKFISALQKIELSFRQRVKGKNGNFNKLFFPSDFEVSKESVNIDWAKFPKKTKLIAVKNDDIYFSMILVKQRNKLKIAIIFPMLD